MKNTLSSLACFSTLFFFSLGILQMCTKSNAHRKEEPEQKIAAVFAFGDSIVDPGNNNNIITFMKANFPPYGKDFPQGKPSGRFCNGRILTDFLVEALGVKESLPPYLDPDLQETDLLTGVSFASGGSGFDPLTSKLLITKSLKDELKMFKGYISRMNQMVGVDRTSYIVNNSICFLVCGSNDIANTYFTIPFVREDYDVQTYTDAMCTSASSFIKIIQIRGPKDIDDECTPSGMRSISENPYWGIFRECSKDQNQAAVLFNSKLEAELNSLAHGLPDSEIVYVDFYVIFLHLIYNATNYGFEVIDKGCCGSGLIEAGALCNSFSKLCEDHNKYLFWDSYHPTEKTYQIIIRHIVDRYLNHII